MKQIAPCPHCGAHNGWFEKRVESYRQYFDENGEPTHAADGDTMGRGGRVKYCYECDRDITRLIREIDPTK